MISVIEKAAYTTHEHVGVTLLQKKHGFEMDVRSDLASGSGLLTPQVVKSQDKWDEAGSGGIYPVRFSGEAVFYVALTLGP